MCGWGISKLCKVILEVQVGNESSLMEAVHSLLEINVHVSVVHERKDILLLDDFFRYCVNGQAHLFVPFHWGVQAEIFDVARHELGIQRVDDNVEEELGGSHVRVWRADIARIVNEVSANGEADVMLLGLLGTDGGDDAAVGDLAPNGYLIVPDEDDGFGPGCHSVTNAAGESAELVGKGLVPYVGGCSVDKVTVLLVLTSYGIDKNVGSVDAYIGDEKELGGLCNRGDVIGGLGVASLHRVAM